jgi:peptidylprolyl isomerase
MPSHEYERLMVRIQEQAEAQVAVENLAEAESFLKENAQRPGVVEIVPGQLQYRVVRQGQGMVVPDNGSPLVHYKGRFIDGSLFGSTEDDGEAMTIPLDQTISGFARAVAGMQEGEKREIYIHPELGYGTSGQLPPNALLIFEVSVVEAGEGALEAPENTPNAAGEEPLSEQAPRSTLPAMTLEEVAIELGIDPQDMDPAFQ